MASDRRFLIGLALRIALLAAAIALLIAACLTPGLAAARVLAGLLVIGAVALLWAHVTRTNMMLTRFVEALNAGDTSVRFAAGRSEERRVGKECCSTCRFLWSPSY